MRLVRDNRADRRRNEEGARKQSSFRSKWSGLDRTSWVRQHRSANGTINALPHARHAVRGRHADRQPRRHHGAGAAGAARGGGDRRGRYAAHRTSAGAARDRHADHQPARTQRSRASRRRSIARLQAGESIALVSDAGTPTVSDPGGTLIRAADRRRHPGRTGSRTERGDRGARARPGCRPNRSHFSGFRRLKVDSRERGGSRGCAICGQTVVFFEAPHRINAKRWQELKRDSWRCASIAGWPGADQDPRRIGQRTYICTFSKASFSRTWASSRSSYIIGRNDQYKLAHGPIRPAIVAEFGELTEQWTV